MLYYVILYYLILSYIMFCYVILYYILLYWCVIFIDALSIYVSTCPIVYLSAHALINPPIRLCLYLGAAMFSLSTTCVSDLSSIYWCGAILQLPAAGIDFFNGRVRVGKWRSELFGSLQPVEWPCRCRAGAVRLRWAEHVWAILISHYRFAARFMPNMPQAKALLAECVHFLCFVLIMTSAPQPA